GKLFLGVSILGFIISSAHNYALAQDHSRIREDNIKLKKVKKLSNAELKSLRRTFNRLNKEVKKQTANPIRRDQKQNYNRIITSGQLYNPEDVKLLYKDSFNPKEEDGVRAEWYMGGELTQTRDVKNIRAGGKIGNFHGGAVVNLDKGTKVFSFGANKGRNSIDMIVGDNVMQGKAQVNALGMADVKMFYNFNTQQFNYTVSKNYKGAGLALAQQFRNGLTITAATLSYNPRIAFLPDKIIVSYVLNNYEARKNTDKASIIAQEKIGILNLEGRLDKTSLALIPTAKVSVKHSW
ncbi:hypothetical protein KY348_04800, partial [Candidatus Woesearchaeota archaeon]|nr:hypothetical protein [Candidatus Woesearchaeota archaeon]